jgi:hypothetical protein
VLYLLNNNFYYLAFFIGGLTDLISSYIMINKGFIETNFYIPFLFPIIVSLMFFIDDKILRNNKILGFIGVVFVLFTFYGLINNLNVYISV